MNILIVDENEVVRRQLFWALRGGNDLQEAASREEAEAILTSMVPDVVLMELLQEGDSDESAGTALVERVLRLAEPPLIIIITRSNRKDVAGALLQAGVFDYLEKPVNLTDLPGILNCGVEIGRERSIQHPLPDILPGIGKRAYVFNVKRG